MFSFLAKAACRKGEQPASLLTFREPDRKQRRRCLA
jgi:hypothetical protein